MRAAHNQDRQASQPKLAQSAAQLLTVMGVEAKQFEAGDITSFSPIDGSAIGQVHSHKQGEIDQAIDKAAHAFLAWRLVPAPRRGELVRLFGNLLREHKESLGRLVSLECGKILQEGLGEVQEMIDICDFAVGLSRQLYGLTIASERPGHRMQESWLPLGPSAVITAFNFPVAVWAWNSALALVCGNPVLWKPSEKTPLCALACQALFERARAQISEAPAALSQVIFGERATGEQLVADTRIALVSATGSSAMGQAVGPRVAARFGRSILELGGNNGIIVCPSADLDMALRAIVFGAVGTAGQRCTSTRRLFVHESIYADLKQRLEKAYSRIPIGDPLAGETLVGPLIDAQAFKAMQSALAKARSAGAKVLGGERLLEAEFPEAYYVQPALVEAPANLDVSEETFAPILYLFSCTDLDQAIAAHNRVPQGLSSAIFSNDMRESELFISAAGSDCGIVNVNIGTSGAEIGGAFGGEKSTGGGRESGSDAWKGYMRRVTTTINYSRELPLAQGIKFDLN